MSDLPLPLFRLARRGGERFEVERIDAWVDVDYEGYDPEDNYTHHLKLKSLAVCLTLETAYAVMRLHGVTEFHDLTQPKWHWGAPLTSFPPPETP